MLRRRTGMIWGALLSVTAAIGLQAGVVGATTCDDICSSTANPCIASKTITVSAGSVIDCGTRELRVTSKGKLELSGGAMTILAGHLNVLSGGELEARGSGTVAGRSITCRAGTISIAGDVNAEGAPGGVITLEAQQALTVSGKLSAKSLDGAQDGGRITLTGGTIVASGDLSVQCGGSASGGSLSLEAAGDVTVSGDLDATGGEGGEVTVVAGTVPAGQGNVTITADAVVDVSATADGGFAGEIDISARGDGLTTGDVAFRGLMNAKGRSGTLDTGGGDGGVVALAATGDVLNDVKTGGIDASGGAPDGEGGEITFTAEKGTVVVKARLRVRSAGLETAGGEIQVLAAGDITLDGELDGVGGGFDGGSVTVESAGGNVTLGSTASIDVSSSSGGGFGGDISLAAGADEIVGTSRLVVNGALTADGSGSLEFPGDGGTLDLSADAEVVVGGALRAKGAAGGSFGGEVTIKVVNGRALIQDSVSLVGQGLGGLGGNLNIETGAALSVTGEVDVRGLDAAGGGRLNARSGGAVTLGAAVTATGTTRGRGGEITVISDNNVTASAVLDATAGGQALRGSGIILAGCAVDVAAAGSLLGSGPSCFNIIQGREQIQMRGKMTGSDATCTNTIRHRPGVRPMVTGTTSPPVRIVPDAAIVPCGVITPTPTITLSPTRTATLTPTITRTPTPSSPTITPTRTHTPTIGSPTITPTATETPTPTPTRTPGGCVGDCNGGGTVTIDELIRGVNIALGISSVDQCPPFDNNGDDSVTIDELVRAVNAALSGCQT